MVARSSSLWETRTRQLNGVGSKHRAAGRVAGGSSVGWVKPEATAHQSAWVTRAQLGLIGFDLLARFVVSIYLAIELRHNNWLCFVTFHDSDLIRSNQLRPGMPKGRASALYDQFTMRITVSILGELRNPQSEVLVDWLRRVLARTLADAVNHLTPMLLSSTHLIARRRHAKP